MRSPQPWLSLALLATCLYCADGVAGSDTPASTRSAVGSVVSEAPDQLAVEAFTRHAQWRFPTDGEGGESLVSDRILDGFEAAPTLLVTADGSAIRWGFKYQEGNIKSVVIGNQSGQLKLLAAVDGITRLTSRSSAPVDTMAEYQQRQSRSGMEPAVVVFVHDEGDLKTCLPLLKRWLQANLIGFNADCRKAALANACTLAAQIAIPTEAFIIGNNGRLRSVKLPKVETSSVPLRSFVQ